MSRTASAHPPGLLRGDRPPLERLQGLEDPPFPAPSAMMTTTRSSPVTIVSFIDHQTEDYDDAAEAGSSSFSPPRGDYPNGAGGGMGAAAGTATNDNPWCWSLLLPQSSSPAASASTAAVIRHSPRPAMNMPPTSFSMSHSPSEDDSSSSSSSASPLLLVRQAQAPYEDSSSGAEEFKSNPLDLVLPKDEHYFHIGSPIARPTGTLSTTTKPVSSSSSSTGVDLNPSAREFFPSTPVAAAAAPVGYSHHLPKSPPDGHRKKRNMTQGRKEQRRRAMIRRAMRHLLEWPADKQEKCVRNYGLVVLRGPACSAEGGQEEVLVLPCREVRRLCGCEACAEEDVTFDSVRSVGVVVAVSDREGRGGAGVEEVLVEVAWSDGHTTVHEFAELRALHATILTG